MTRYRTSTLLLTTLFVLSVTVTGVSAVRTLAEAESVCETWLTGFAQGRGGWAGSTSPHTAGVEELLSDDEELLAWCFSVEPQGHVVVPVLRALSPVKVYSETSSFDIHASIGFEQMLREKLTSMHEHFREEYGNLDAIPAAPEARRPELAVPADWEHLREVGPLLNTSWHQLEPYNGFCPMGNGGRCVVGCVPLAAAQLMYYYRWPEAGFGEFSYYWPGDGSCGSGGPPGDTLSAVFRDPYDWAGMPHDVPPGGRNDAVAELCYEVGVSLGTWYGHCGSSAGFPDLALFRYFRYGGGTESRNGRDYSTGEWFALIQNEMGQDRPIIYYYSGPNHFLICDGWRVVGDEMQMHMNYGGTGPYNGWYVIDEIHGHNGDHTREGMIINVVPDAGVMLGPHANGDYASIQDAIDGVESGTDIRLFEGTYTGPGNRDINFFGKDVTLRSHRGDPRICVIDAGGSESDPHRCFQLTSGGGAEAVISDLWLTGGWTDWYGGAVYCADSSPTIEGCVIEGNTSLLGGGGVCANTLYPMSPLTITGCTIHGNEGGGVLVRGGDATIDSTLVTWNEGGAAVSCEYGGQVEIACSDLYANEGGDWVGCVEEQLGVGGNISADPVYCAPWDGILTLSSISQCMPENNPCGVKVGALGEGCEDYIVYPDGRGRFPTIQAAVDLWEETGGSYNGYVVLADGVFTGYGNRDIEVNRSVKLRSASATAENCVIDCEGGRGFSVSGSAWTTCRLDSITVTNARAPSGSGAVVDCSGGPRAVLIGCKVTNCEAYEGGVVSATDGSIVTIRRSELSGNSAERGGAVYAADSAAVWIAGSTLVDNAAFDGSSVYCDDSTLTLEASIVALGSGGKGVSWEGDRPLNISCTDIYGNEGGDWRGALFDFLGVDGNIREDPLFCDPSAGDYHIADNSPCAVVCGDYWWDMEQVGAHGAACESGVSQYPVGFLHLGQNYPNPFNPATELRLILPEDGHVRLVVYDLCGRVVATLVDGQRTAGRLIARWDGTNDDGRPVAAGVYFARLEQAGRSDVRKLVLLK